MFEQDVLDFVRRDVLPTADDQLLRSPAQAQVALRVEYTQITGPEPAVEERLLVRLDPVEITRSDAGASNKDVPRPSETQRSSLVVDHPDISTRRNTHAPGHADPGRERLEEIWWLASVIPYAWVTGTVNACSSACSSTGASAALHDLTKRRCETRRNGGCLLDHHLMDGRRSRVPGDSEVPQRRPNPRLLRRAGMTTLPPAASADHVLATSPCTWKSGITQYEMSSLVKA